MSFQLDLNWHPPISESYWWKWKLLSHVRLYVTSMTTVHWILQARILEWVGFPFSRESSQPRDQTQVSHIVGRVFTSWVTGKPKSYWLSSVQSLSRVQLFVTPWTTARQTSLSIINSWSLPKPMSIELVMPSSHLILCRPLLLLPPIPASIRVFSNESVLLIRWPKYWSFSFNISPPKEHSGLIFRKAWLDLLAVQETLKSLLHQFSFFGQVILLYDDNLWKKSKSCPVGSVSSRCLT